jgi:hypothetical protein
MRVTTRDCNTNNKIYDEVILVLLTITLIRFYDFMLKKIIIRLSLKFT